MSEVRPFDLITMGRVGVDIYPEQTGVGLQDVRTFAKFLGGSATNVAVAAARLGHRSAVITRTGDDPFGTFIHQALGGFGVDDRFVAPVAQLPTPVTFCEIFPPDDFPLYFYREPTAPDLQIAADELDLEAIATAKVFWVTVTGLSQEPSFGAHLAALKARAEASARPGGQALLTVLDLDYRAMFWPSAEQATERIAQVLPYVDVAVGNREECEVAVGQTEPDQAADALLERGVKIAIVKQGPAGVLGAGSLDGGSGQRVVVKPVPVDVVNGLGAGDSFGGSLVHGLLEGWDLERTLQFANAAGAIVAGQLSCADAMPSVSQVQDVLARGRV
jgi:5-dehydro-2-deoxygluconokinase